MKRIVKSVTAVGAVLPCLLLATTAPARADSTGITWRNAQTGLYLAGDYNGYVWDQPSVGPQSLWNDFQNSDGSWNEQNGTGMCLVWAGDRLVVMNNCNPSADQTSLFARWYEVPTATGWKLENRDSYYILDDDGNGHVYANSSDVGNSDLNQRWH